MNGLFGIQPRDLAANALVLAFEEKEKDGAVLTGSGTTGAYLHPKHKEWVLCNSAWWDWGGAHYFVRQAAARLRRAGVVYPRKRGLVLIGHVLDVAEGQDPNVIAVWAVAEASRQAWLDHKKAKKVA